MIEKLSVERTASPMEPSLSLSILSKNYKISITQLANLGATKVDADIYQDLAKTLLSMNTNEIEAMVEELFTKLAEGMKKAFKGKFMFYKMKIERTYDSLKGDNIYTMTVYVNAEISNIAELKVVVPSSGSKMYKIISGSMQKELALMLIDLDQTEIVILMDKIANMIEKSVSEQWGKNAKSSSA